VKINYVEARSIITKSNIPSVDYVINPYIGCQHGCIYCYAEFMKRFTNHKGDKWGEFLDIKNFDQVKIKPERYNDKTILLSSVTDPYCPLESKFRNTRKILEKLIGTKAKIQILTKSKLVQRDIDLFQQFENIQVGISLNTLEADFAKIIEPRASKPQERIQALQNIADNKINTFVFISPIFPEITNWRKIIEKALPITNEFWFENLNFRAHNIKRIMNIITEFYPKLEDYYDELRKETRMWDIIENEKEEYCQDKEMKCMIEFHHGGFSNKK